MSPAITTELQALALTLAYDHASSVLENDCVDVSFEAEAPGWWELPATADAEIDDCVRFLEMRGLLERHPRRADWIAIRDESEAEQ